MFMVLPVLTTYGMALQGASEALIGLAIGIYGLGAGNIPYSLWLALRPSGSQTADCRRAADVCARQHHRRPLPLHLGIILGRALQGSGAIAAAVMALLSDLTREQNRTKAMAFIGVSFGVTFAIAMVLGPVITHSLGLHALFWMIAVLATIGIALTLWVVPDSKNHVLNRESGMVKGCFSKVIAEPRLLKLNFGIMCLHILLMSTFVALPGQLASAGFPAAEHWKIYLVTMLILVCLRCALHYLRRSEAQNETRLRGLRGVTADCRDCAVGAGPHFWELIAGVQLFFLAFNLMEARCRRLSAKSLRQDTKAPRWAFTPPASFSAWRLAGHSAAGWMVCLTPRPFSSPVRCWRCSGCLWPAP